MNILIERDIEHIRDLAEVIVEDSDAEILDVQLFVKNRLSKVTVIVDAIGGINIETCALISKELDKKFDEEQYRGGNYKIEVSSPGIDRPLIVEADFRRKTGKAITLWHNEEEYESPVEGVIKAIENGRLLIENKGKAFSIDLDKIDRGKLQLLL